MCGIAGALAFDNSSTRITPPFIARMRDALAHRGPDGVGLWVSPDGAVGLGHRRLAIIDLSDSALQPMSTPDGALRIIFNGDIYNHAEIRAELDRLAPRRWQTDHSDTEVILQAFAQWGISCLDRFRGMFAFALWDARSRELWLVRDRIGIKPLYFSNHHGRLTFASEIKALLEDHEQTREVNEDALFHFLSFLTSPAPDTLFSGIHKLPAGSWLRASSDGRIEQRRWWDVWDHTQPQCNVSDADLAARVLDELRTSVRYRKVSDVPVGVFLSGGIDSSTNTLLFSEGESRPVRTFSIGYDADYKSYPSELPYARRIAELARTDHHERLLSQQDLLDFLPRMIRAQDEPIADPVCVPIYYLSKLAREHGVIVCQVGEGSDELFWGYSSWKAKLTLERWNRLAFPTSLKRAGLAGLRAAGQESSLPYEWLRRGVEGLPVFWGGAEAFTEAEKQRLLSPRLRAQFARRTSWEALAPIYRRFTERAWEPSPLHWMTYLDLNLRLPELLLMRVDKMSMQVALEARVPFLDHKFVELALSIPAAVKTRGGESKALLKRAVRGLIPDDIIHRKKQGFAVPVHEWLLDRLGDFARAELDAFCRQTDFLDRNEVFRLIERRRAKQVWYLLNLALWWKEFFAAAPARPAPVPALVATS